MLWRIGTDNIGFSDIFKEPLKSLVMLAGDSGQSIAHVFVFLVNQGSIADVQRGQQEAEN